MSLVSVNKVGVAKVVSDEPIRIDHNSGAAELVYAREILDDRGSCLFGSICIDDSRVIYVNTARGCVAVDGSVGGPHLDVLSDALGDSNSVWAGWEIYPVIALLSELSVPRNHVFDLKVLLLLQGKRIAFSPEGAPPAQGRLLLLQASIALQVADVLTDKSASATAVEWKQAEIDAFRADIPDVDGIFVKMRAVRETDSDSAIIGMVIEYANHIHGVGITCQDLPDGSFHATAEWVSPDSDNDVISETRSAPRKHEAVMLAKKGMARRLLARGIVALPDRGFDRVIRAVLL